MSELMCCRVTGITFIYHNVDVELEKSKNPKTKKITFVAASHNISNLHLLMARER